VGKKHEKSEVGVTETTAFFDETDNLPAEDQLQQPDLNATSGGILNQARITTRMPF